MYTVCVDNKIPIGIRRNNLLAEVMEKVARKSVEVAADSRCMYIVHQPPIPEKVKQFRKKIDLWNNLTINWKNNIL